MVSSAPMLTLEQLAVRAADEASDGRTYRRGPGLPVSLSEHLRPDDERRSGPVDVLFVGADEVSGRGDLLLSPEDVDVDVTGARRVVVILADGEGGLGRLVRTCSGPALPGVVHRVVTELAVLDVTPDGLVVRQVAPGVSARDVQERVSVPLLAGPDLDRIPI